MAARHFSFWDLRTVLGLAVFGILLVAVSLFLSIRIDLITLPRRTRRGKAQLLNRTGAWARLVKFILGGVLIPLAAFIAANRIRLPNHATPMGLALQAGIAEPALPPTTKLGNAVLHASSTAVRVEGIRALQAIGSSAALDQLFRILTSDPAVLQEGSAFEALAKALASFGAQAEPKLLELIRHVPVGARGSAAAPPGWMFEMYFATPFADVRALIETHGVEAARRDAALGRLQEAEAELERALSGVEAGTAAPGTRTVPSLVMQSFLATNVENDPELLAFARTTAADTTWSDAIRGQALLLVAKLGSADDLPDLYAHVDDADPALQACAMEAIDRLSSKASAAPR